MQEDMAIGVEAVRTEGNHATKENLSRATLCLPDFERDTILHGGDPGFEDVVQQYFSSPESRAAERLIVLKQKLAQADREEFWTLLMEEICDVMGSQCGFVAKRILVDDANAAVEMPALGEPGSCLLGVAFYLNNGHDINELYRDYRYHAYGRSVHCLSEIVDHTDRGVVHAHI